MAIQQADLVKVDINIDVEMTKDEADGSLEAVEVSEINVEMEDIQDVAVFMR